jgi:hypothetical protein
MGLGIQVTVRIKTTKEKACEDMTNAKQALSKALDAGLTKGTFEINGVSIKIERLMSGK